MLQKEVSEGIIWEREVSELQDQGRKEVVVGKQEGMNGGRGRRGWMQKGSRRYR